MDYISQINSVKNSFMYVIILVLTVCPRSSEGPKGVGPVGEQRGVDTKILVKFFLHSSKTLVKF